MELQDIKPQDNLTALAKSDRQLALEIQQKLIDFKLLVSPADGQFGKKSQAALEQFQQLLKSDDATNLYLTKVLPQPKLNSIKNDFAARITKYMVEQNYLIETAPGQLNIIYIEGIDPNGELNNDAMDLWNDLRLVLKVENGTPKIINAWTATTEPGWKYTKNPLNPEGAFRIKFGQYRSWRVGMHKTQEALVQCGEIIGYRDRNQDGLRTGDLMVKGSDFGVNQHHGGSSATIGGWSAGCLVGQSVEGHKEFMQLVKSDLRYQQDPSFVFLTTIIAGDKL